jgi:hypothetical protein
VSGCVNCIHSACIPVSNSIITQYVTGACYSHLVYCSNDNAVKSKKNAIEGPHVQIQQRTTRYTNERRETGRRYLAMEQTTKPKTSPSGVLAFRSTVDLLGTTKTLLYDEKRSSS